MHLAAAGTTLGGSAVAPDAAAAQAAIAQALATGPLPGSATVEDGDVLIDRGEGRAPFRIRIEVAQAPQGAPYRPVAATRVTGPDQGRIVVSDSASPDHVRRAVAASVAELAMIASERAADTRTDATSMLAEGSQETRLSPRDVGRIAELRVVTADLNAAQAAGDAARLAQLRTEAAALVVSMGLVEQSPSRPVHSLADNAPVVGPEAAQRRIDACRRQLGPAVTDVDMLLDLAASPDGRACIAEVRAARAEHRARLRAWAQEAIHRRDQADLALTARVDAALDADPGHVFDRLVLGGGWAATADFVTMGAPAEPRHGLPPVLCVSAGHDPWGGRGDLLMGQVPTELEIDGLPFQPADFADEPTGFTRSADFAAAVGAARAMAGMPTYQGQATSIEPRPETGANSWPDGARYRVTVGDRAFFAASVDVVSGPGPARIPLAGDPTGRRFTDPGTGFSVDHRTSPPTFRNRAGVVVDPDTLPEPVRSRLGAVPGSAPQLADLEGRLTDQRIVDPGTGLSVDPATREVFDSAGRPIDPGHLDLATGHRLGFGPDGSFSDRRYVVHPSGYAVHPANGQVVDLSTGFVVDPATLDPAVAADLADEVRRRRIQFGGQNLAADYRPGDRVLVFGAGASGAWDIEQATQSQASTVDWAARPRPGLENEPADVQLEQSFRDGYNRRNTVPRLGAYSPEAQLRTNRSLRTPIEVRQTVDGEFAVRFDDGSTAVYDRVVFSIGQEAADSGGAANLLRQIALEPITGPAGEINGLSDAVGVRVLGAASVARATLARVTPAYLAEVRELIGEQAGQLPADSRGIAPSIRSHGQRIAEANRPTTPSPPPANPGPAPPSPAASGSSASAGPVTITATDVPGSEFRGDSRTEADAEAIEARARQLLAGLLTEQFGFRMTPIPSHEGGFRVEPPRGRPFVVHVSAAPLAGGRVAQSTLDHAHRAHLIVLSDRVADQHIERALVHEVAEIMATRPTRMPWRRAATADLLHTGEVDQAAGPRLSGHDHGRLAELRLLADRAAAAPDESTRARLTAEVSALAEHLGVRDGEPGSEVRRAVIHRHLSDNARAMLGDLGRAADQLASTDADALRQVQDAAAVPTTAHPVDAAAAALQDLVAATREATDGERVAAVQELVGSLEPTVAHALAQTYPDLVGNRDGVRYELRIEANRLRMEGVRDALRARVAAGTASGSDQRRLATLESFLTPQAETVRAADGSVSVEIRQRRFVIFDPTGSGRVAEVLGDLATAQNVAMLVPGMRNNLENFERLVQSGEGLRDAAGRQRTALVVWLGYHSPQGIGAVAKAAAQQGARLLRASRAALALEIRPEARTTVLAHSYGTVVTSLAVQRGAPFDNVVVMGSPGLGENVRSAADLGLRAGARFFASRAPGDPVSYSEWHGVDPADFVDAIRLGTDGGAVVRGHSSYYRPGGGSLRNLAAVLTGGDPTSTATTVAAETRIGPLGGWGSGARAAVHALRGVVPVDTVAWSGDEGRILLRAQARAAAAFLNHAAASEPAATAAVSAVAAEVGAQLVGLENRLKSAESFNRKLSDAIDQNPGADLDALLVEMKDAVRYTLQLPAETYSVGAQRVVDTLTAWGMESVKFKNTWGTDGYKGINSFWRDPRTGQVFELQIHTVDSFEAKMETHRLYELERLSSDAEVRAEYIRLQEARFRLVPVPPGASGVAVRLVPAGSASGPDGR